MRIIYPSAEIIPRMKPLKKIELCGRVCYKSEDKITEDSAERFVKKLIERGHTSVLEHARVVLSPDMFKALSLVNIPYGLFQRMGYVDPGRWRSSIVMNARDFIALGGTLEQLKALEEADDYMSVRFICDRAIANELVRHRVFSFSQVSSRYVNYKEGIDFILPVPFDWAHLRDSTTIPISIPAAYADPRYQAWYFLCEDAEGAYKRMIAEGCTPQEARAVLPLSTSTELIMTGTYKQWREMLKLRMAPAAHPQMRYLLEKMLELPEVPEEVKKYDQD